MADLGRVAPRWAYASLAAASAHTAIANRGARLLALVASLVALAIQYELWSYVYGRRAAMGALDWPAMQTYLLVAFVTNSLLAPSTEAMLLAAVREGDIAHLLVRPVDPMAAAFASAVGAAGFELVAAIGVAILGAALVFDVVPPGGLAAAAFSASLALAFLVKFLLSYLTVVIALRTLHVQGLVWTRTAVFNLLSGALMPIAVMPEALRAVVEALPFRDVIATPIELFLGQRAGLDAALALGRQAAWVLALTALARWAWQRNVGRLEIQGG